MARITMSILIFYSSSCVLAFKSFTVVNHVLVGHVLTSFHSSDWIDCIEACQKEARCVSYNYKFINPDGLCELKDHGVDTDCQRRETLIYSPSFVFQQIRDTKVLCLLKTVYLKPKYVLQEPLYEFKI